MAKPWDNRAYVREQVAVGLTQELLERRFQQPLAVQPVERCLGVEAGAVRRPQEAGEDRALPNLGTHRETAVPRDMGAHQILDPRILDVLFPPVVEGNEFGLIGGRQARAYEAEKRFRLLPQRCPCAVYEAVEQPLPLGVGEDGSLEFIFRHEPRCFGKIDLDRRQSAFPDEVDLPLLRAVVDEDFHQQLARGTRSPPRDGRFTQDDIRSQAVHRYFETRVIISKNPGLVGEVYALAAVPGNHGWQHYLAALLDDLFSSFMEGCLVGVGAFGTFAVPEVLPSPGGLQDRSERPFAGRAPVGLPRLDLGDVRGLVL